MRCAGFVPLHHEPGLAIMARTAVCHRCRAVLRTPGRAAAPGVPDVRDPVPDVRPEPDGSPLRRKLRLERYS